MLAQPVRERVPPCGQGKVYDDRMSELTGSTYKRDDGLWEFRVKARNNRIVATSGGQGYRRRKTAERTMRNLLEPELTFEDAEFMVGAPLRIIKPSGLRRTFGHAVVYQRDDGLFDWRILRKGKIIAVSHNQGYKNVLAATKTLINVVEWPHEVV